MKILKGILPTIPLGKYLPEWIRQLYNWWVFRKDSKWQLQEPVFWSERVLYFSEDEGNNCFYLIVLIVSLTLFLWIAFAPEIEYMNCKQKCCFLKEHLTTDKLWVIDLNLIGKNFTLKTIRCFHFHYVHSNHFVLLCNLWGHSYLETCFLLIIIIILFIFPWPFSVN